MGEQSAARQGGAESEGELGPAASSSQEQAPELGSRSALDDLSDISFDGNVPLMSPCPSPGPGVYVHVSQSGLLDLRQKLTQGRQIEDEDVHKVLNRRQSITVPLDIRCAGSPFLDLPSPTDLDDVCEKLGAHDMAQGLVKAHDFTNEGTEVPDAQ